MATRLMDPLQGDFPEIIEEFLQHGNMKCIAFNRRGTLLAAGCADGSCVIWDFETRGVAKELRDKDCIAPITSVCWSKYGHRLLASATDKSLTLWDVLNGEKIARLTLPQTTLHARLHPGSCAPSVCLACPLSSAPILVDLNTGSSTVLPVSVGDGSSGPALHPRNKFSDGSPPFTPTAANFDKHGELIYVGNSKGEILILDSKSVEVYAVIPISGGTVVKDVVFSRNGKYLLTNSNDRVIRVYENLLPVKGAAKALEQMNSGADSELPGIEKLKEVGSKCLVLFREFQDAVTRMQWKAPCFSGDGEWIIGASASKGEHKLYIWDRVGHLVKILEGPKESLIDLAWHPIQPIVVSVSIAGLAYIWAEEHVENWSAFAPDFKELEENEEYVEREDEFDINSDEEKDKELEICEDDEVDIDAFDERETMFSDSDASMEELVILPVAPTPDAPKEQPDKCLESSSKLADSNHLGSPYSMNAVQNGKHVAQASSPLEGVANSVAEEAAGVLNSKRRRRPSAKGLEMDNGGTKGKEVAVVVTKGKSRAKAAKTKSKYVDLTETESDGDVEDDVTEDDM